MDDDELTEHVMATLAKKRRWRQLLRIPTDERRSATEKLLATDDPEVIAAELDQLVAQAPGKLLPILSALPKFDFLLSIVDDNKCLTVAGPNVRWIRKLLQVRRTRRRRVSVADRSTCERVHEIVQEIVGRLQTIPGVKFALLHQLRDERQPSLLCDHDRNVNEAWTWIRNSLPERDRNAFPLNPPAFLDASQPERRDLCPPSQEEADPSLYGGTYWPTWQQRSPFRVPDWRLCRAYAIVLFGRYCSRKRDDELTCRAARFIRAIMTPDIDLAEIRSEFPDVFGAHELRQSSGDVRVELECRLLAGEPVESIAAKLDLSATVVTAYAELFFDVLPYLKSRCWIKLQVLGQNIPPGLAGCEQLAKSVAYYGGQHVFDRLWPSLRRAARAPNGFGGIAGDPLTEKLGLLAQCLNLPDSPETRHDLVRAFPGIQTIFAKPVEPVSVLGVVEKQTTNSGGDERAETPSHHTQPTDVCPLEDDNAASNAGETRPMFSRAVS